jgi:hypothetical protein
MRICLYRISLLNTTFGCQHSLLVLLILSIPSDLNETKNLQVKWSVPNDSVLFIFVFHYIIFYSLLIKANVRLVLPNGWIEVNIYCDLHVICLHTYINLFCSSIERISKTRRLCWHPKVVFNKEILYKQIRIKLRQCKNAYMIQIVTNANTQIINEIVLMIF